MLSASWTATSADRVLLVLLVVKRPLMTFAEYIQGPDTELLNSVPQSGHDRPDMIVASRLAKLTSSYVRRVQVQLRRVFLKLVRFLLSIFGVLTYKTSVHHV